MINLCWSSQATFRTALPPKAKETEILDHLRELEWRDFLTDMHLCAEALCRDAVENIASLAGRAMSESVHMPPQDGLDHIAFGINRLKQELAIMPPGKRKEFLARISDWLESLNGTFHVMNSYTRAMIKAVCSDYAELRKLLLKPKG